MDWKPTPEEKRAIRAYPAKYERRKPRALIIEIGERANGDTISTNVLAFGKDWSTGVEASDLHQPTSWSDLDRGIAMIDDKAIVDFYVYERVFEGHGDLLTNVQAHVELVDGTPRLVALTGTGMPKVAGEELAAFMTR
ncbi:hypothetical protein RPALISO_225 [Ruegeria phage RpAliso]|nr:hypothetical protein RPALISO_225 [Ruegeria phage RpAliso]